MHECTRVIESSSKKQLDVNSIFSCAWKMSAFYGARIACHRLAPSPISGAYPRTEYDGKKGSRKNRTVCFPGSVSPYLMQFRSQPKSATLRHEFWQNTGCLTFCSRKNYGTRRSKATSQENRDRQELVIYANAPGGVTTYNFVLVMFLFIRFLTLYREKMQKIGGKYPRHPL